MRNDLATIDKTEGHMTRTIRLTTGQTALVDDEDFDRVSQWKWHYQPQQYGDKGYAVRSPKPSDTAHPRRLVMHRYIINAPDDARVDHINGNTLDNRRSNLRLATNAQNKYNSRKYTRGGYPASSQYKGVSWNQQKGRWQSRIAVNKHLIWLGSFSDEVAAALAYDQAARELHGEFARTNFTVTGERVEERSGHDCQD